MQIKDYIILFSGYSKSHIGTGIADKAIGIIVTIDARTDTIIEAECTIIPELSRKFIGELLVGQSLRNGTSDITEVIANCYNDPHCRAVIAALNIIGEKYVHYKQLTS